MRRSVSLLLRNANLLSRTRNIIYPSFIKSSFLVETADMSSETESKTDMAIRRRKCDGGATSLKEAKEKYEFFWKKFSPFSQHYESSFKVEDIEFNCAEQYMMYKKAMLFGDGETAEEIMRTKSPSRQKSLGRQVKKFDDELWKKNCERIVEEANEAKFGQNPRLKKILFATHPKVLVEASPVDRIWGIGLAEDDINAWDERSWRGSNYLGYCLTYVRRRLMEKEGLLKDNGSMAEAAMAVEEEGLSDEAAMTIDRSNFQGGATSLEEAKEKYEFFWKKTPFSQHYESSFKVEDKEFNSAEQYMMYQKAMLFGDADIAEKILSTKSQQKQKSFGRKVEDFDDKVWKKNCRRIVDEANEAKFGQNKHLKKILFATHPKILVEANPEDRIWGIGLAEDDINAWNERSWRGTNYLGYCLTNVRNRLMEKEGLLKETKSKPTEATAVEKGSLLKDNKSNAAAAMAIDRSKCDGGATSLEEAKKIYEFFWKKVSPFSQDHEASFKVEDKEFNCADQYMMYKKAMLFGDKEIAEKILSRKSPRKQRDLGQKVKNFNGEVWNQNCQRIVEEGNMAKFGQNPRLKKILFATHPKVLVEASPVDRIWGIGLAEDDINAWDEQSWKGTNYLGYCLTNVRKRLMEKEGLLKETDSKPVEAMAVEKEGLLKETENKPAQVMAVEKEGLSNDNKSNAAAATDVDRSNCNGGTTSLEEAKETYEFFWKKDSPFSQHYDSSFKVEGKEFNCAEQYMMYKKAMLFEDEEIAKKILSKISPAKQKALGRKVRNFNEEVWNKNCQRIVEEANEAKFGQNEHLKEILFATHPKILVEASPEDRIWGIGLAEDDINAWDERSWKGTNYLGYCLTNVRKRLMEKEDLLKETQSKPTEDTAVEKEVLSKDNKSNAVAAMAIDRSNSNNGFTSLEEAKEKYEFFWKKDSPFSQHHDSSFKVEDKEFNCAEQYMMYKKAMLFGDKEIAEKILSRKSPRKQRDLGQKVKNFNDKVWNQNCQRIVEEANMEKFGQNEHLKEILFATHPKILVEANPLDCFWGIGVAEDNVNAWNEPSWKGTNYLGYCLTDVRKRLMEKEGLLKETKSNPTEATAVEKVCLSKDNESMAAAAAMAIDISNCNGGAMSLEE